MSTFIHVKFYSVGGKTHSLELLSTAAGTVDKSDVSTLDLDSFYIIATLSVHLRNKSRSVITQGLLMIFVTAQL